MSILRSGQSTLKGIAQSIRITDPVQRRIDELKEENASLYNLLAHIRAAAGDPEGKLMQDELIEHIRSLATGKSHV